MSAKPRAVAAGPGAARALHAGGSGKLEVALGSGGYIRLGGDGWILIAEPRAPMGPLTLVVAGLAGEPAQPGWPARVEHGELIVGPHEIALGGAEVDTAVPPHDVGQAYVHDALATALAAVPGPPASLAPGIEAIERLDDETAVRLLAGRGEGLTPAGDDVLAGCAAWRAVAGARGARLSVLAGDRTSPIGLAYLRCAERGELPDVAARLLAAVVAGDTDGAARRARVLATWGASSGSALLWGIAAASRGDRAGRVIGGARPPGAHRAVTMRPRCGSCASATLPISR